MLRSGVPAASIVIALGVLAPACRTDPGAEPPADCVDRDGDGYGQGCTAGDDCDDTDAAAYRWVDAFVDQDLDGHGGAATRVCAGDTLPAGFAEMGDDCDDTDAAAYRWVDAFVDQDLDGHGGSATRVCAGDALPAGLADTSDDCDDGDSAVHPGAPEPDCTDPKDYDCDGIPGTGDPDGDGVSGCDDCAPRDASLYAMLPAFRDADGDGFGAGAQLEVCGGAALPAGYAAVDGDCDDADPASFPHDSGCLRVRWAHVSAGGLHACALDDAGTAYCWGGNRYGQLGIGIVGPGATAPVPVDVSGLAAGTTFEKISAGERHTCAIDAGGVVYCWGDNQSGQLGQSTTDALVATPVRVDPAALGNARAIDVAVGAAHTCAATETGAVYCWGSNGAGDLGVSGPSTSTPVRAQLSMSAVRVFAGYYQSCALGDAGALYCWGDLGIWSAYETSAVPTCILPGGAVSFAISAAYACATWASGGASCAGYGAEGQLGAGPDVYSSESWVVVAAPESASAGLASITVGSSVACALTPDGAAFCWGNGELGALGDGRAGVQASAPVSVDGAGLASDERWVELSTGAWSACGVTSAGRLACWGSDGSDQLGDRGEPTSVAPSRPVATSALAAGESITQIAVAMNHACEVTSANRVLCWGRNLDGRLGDGTTGPGSRAPVVVPLPAASAGAGFIQVAVANSHTCALASDGAAYCWGSDIVGQLGNDSQRSPQASPVPVDRSIVSGDGKLAKIFAAARNSCAIANDGSGYCWGYRSYASNPSGYVMTPVRIDTTGLGGDSRLVDIAPGHYPCAVTADGRAFCWETTTPAQVDLSQVTGSKTVAHIVSDDYPLPEHRCILMADGAAYCWGELGELLGLGSIPATAVTSPAPVDASLAAGGLVSLSAGQMATCAVDVAGAVLCWGFDDDALIDGASQTVVFASPTPVVHSGGSLTFSQVSVGYWSACALATDGAAWCWGFNAFGQLGDGGDVPLATRPTVVSAYR